MHALQQGLCHARRHCEHVNASTAKPSKALRETLDGFAVLAMTGMRALAAQFS